MVSLKGQSALVTGSSSGIGGGIARAMAAAGAKVVVNYAHSKDAVEQPRKTPERRHEDPDLSFPQTCRGNPDEQKAGTPR